MTSTTDSVPIRTSIVEREEHGLYILSPAEGAVRRRVLFINVSGGPSDWIKYRDGLMPSNRLWGCVELVRLGYEVGLVKALPDFYLHRNPLPHDLRLFGAIRKWLRPQDIVYCSHNTLYWIPLLKSLGLVKCRVVSLLYAREPLNQSRAHDGIIALNPAAADHARKLAPKAKVAHLGWGMDLNFLPQIPYQPESFLCCGRTQRDHRTLSVAAARSKATIRVFSHQVPADIKWSANVELVQGGAGWETRLSYRDLLHNHYARAAASLVIIKPDPIEYTACGFTNLLEAMAMSRPVILTRTSALQTEIDIEKAGCGLHVPPGDAEALAAAITTLFEDPARAKTMGEVGRQLCENHYNTDRFGSELHAFFESL